MYILNNMMIYIKIDIKLFSFFSYDQFIVQYAFLILHKWEGHCV